MNFGYINHRILFGPKTINYTGSQFFSDTPQFGYILGPSALQADSHPLDTHASESDCDIFIHLAVHVFVGICERACSLGAHFGVL